MENVSLKTRVMDFVASKGGVTTFREVQRFIIEQVRGYEWSEYYRGYYSSAFKNGCVTRWGTEVAEGYFRKPGREKRFLQKQPNGKYFLVNAAR